MKKLWRERAYIFMLLFVVLMHAVFFTGGEPSASPRGGPAQEQKDYAELMSPGRLADLLRSDNAAYFVFFLLLVAFLLFLMLGVTVDIAYFFLNRSGRQLIERAALFQDAAWGILDVCRVAVIFLFAQSLIWIVDAGRLLSSPYFGTHENMRLMLEATLVDLVAVAAVFYFATKQKHSGPSASPRGEASSLGITSGRLLQNVKYGVVAYIGLMPLLTAMLVGTSLLLDLLGIPAEPQVVLVMLTSEKHVPTLIYMSVFTGLLGPVIEEIFFRGFVYKALRKRAGILGGILASAAFFAYVHSNLASFMPILCLGIVLAYIFEKTGSIVSSMTVHIIHNSASLLFLFFLKTASG